MEISAALVNPPGSHRVVLRTGDSEHVLGAIAEVHNTLRQGVRVEHLGMTP